jgi:hypothetical protein
MQSIQSIQTISGHHSIGQLNQASLGAAGAGLAGTVKRWLNKMIGCGHKDLSRPFGNQGQSYRVCLDCGAQRRFNTGRWEMQGDFYYSLPTSRHFRALNGLSALKRIAS